MSSQPSRRPHILARAIEAARPDVPSVPAPMCLNVPSPARSNGAKGTKLCQDVPKRAGIGHEAGNDKTNPRQSAQSDGAIRQTRPLSDRQLAAARRITCPLLALWSARGPLASWYQAQGGPLAIWRTWAGDVQGRAVDGGHFFPEEAPEETAGALADFVAPTQRL